MQEQMITILKIAVITGALVAASIQDLKTRQIDDRIWMASIPVGVLLTAAEILMTPGYPILPAGISMALSLLLAFGLYHFGLYGGADAKAIGLITATMPLLPFIVMMNAVALSMTVIPACVLRNVEWAASGKPLFRGIKASPLHKALAFLSAFRVSPEAASSVHLNVIEVVKDGERRLKLFRRVDDDLGPAGSDPVWVTLAVPMVVVILGGFLITLMQEVMI